MSVMASSKRLRKPILTCVGLFSLSLGFLVLVRGQENPQWRIVQQLSAQTQKASYVDRAQASEEPESPPSPILEAVFFHDSLTGWAVGDDGVVLRTRDGGQTWAANQINFPVNLNGLFFQDEGQGWAVGDSRSVGAILRTEDGGKNWRLQSKVEGFELSGLHDVWFADEQHGWAVGEAQQGGAVQGVILATQDGGLHWQPQYLAKGRSSALSAVKFADAQHGWAVGHNVILYTDTGGQYWREQRYARGEYFFGVDFINATDGWVVGSSGTLLQTTDGGGTWYLRQLPSEYQRLWLADVKFIDSVRGWVVGDEGAIFSTKNGGQTWNLESIRTSEYLRNLASTPRGIFTVGNNGIILRRQL
jgi:photosystem II stability/assembly factor-like uncharacterized protein